MAGGIVDIPIPRIVLTTNSIGKPKSARLHRDRYCDVVGLAPADARADTGRARAVAIAAIYEFAATVTLRRCAICNKTSTSPAAAIRPPTSGTAA